MQDTRKAEEVYDTDRGRPRIAVGEPFRFRSSQTALQARVWRLDMNVWMMTCSIWIGYPRQDPEGARDAG